MASSFAEWRSVVERWANDLPGLESYKNVIGQYAQEEYNETKDLLVRQWGTSDGKLRWVSVAAVAASGAIAVAPWGTLGLIVSVVAQFPIVNAANGMKDRDFFNRFSFEPVVNNIDSEKTDHDSKETSINGDHHNDLLHFDSKVAIVVAALFGTISRSGLLSARAGIVISLTGLAILLNKGHLKQRAIALSGLETLSGFTTVMLTTLPIFARRG